MSHLIVGTIKKSTVVELHDYLASQPENPTVLINSMGGDPTHGIAAACLIATNLAPVTTANIAYVGSAATAIYLAGAKRLMYKYAQFMIHDGNIAIEGNYIQATKALQEHFADHKIYCKLFEDQTKRSQDFWYSKTLGKDLIMGAAECLKAGVCHEII